jgi:hypothetical protein
MRLEYAMSHMGLWRPKGAPPGPIADANVVAICPACQTRQTLAEATFLEGPDLSVYGCQNGCPIPLVEIRRVGEEYQLAARTPLGLEPPPK